MNTSVLVTGSNGQLGSELREICQNYPTLNLVFTDVDELDITDSQTTKKFISELAPGWIINCAGYTAVDRAESEPEKALKLNADTLYTLTESLSAYGGKLIHFSSDFVFDGKADVPYTEDHSARPLSVYGESKLAGENIALTYTHAMVIRTSWLYSVFGNNFVKTVIRLSNKVQSMGVVNDQTGTPTYALDLAKVVMDIISSSESGLKSFTGGLYNYSNEGKCTWYEFASAIRDKLNLSININPISTSEYPLPSKRPAWSVLDKSKIKSEYGLTIPEWEKSLEICLTRLKLLNNGS